MARVNRKPRESRTHSLRWEQVSDSRAVVPRHVVLRQFAAETVLLNVESGHYYGMDEAGTRFFEVLKASQDLSAALVVLSGEFEVEEERLRDDLLRYCQELLGLGLIELESPRA
jgi:hypothetical protein